MVILNGINYILGIHYMDVYCVRKIRLSMAGNILEDVTDTVLANDTIKRVSGKNVVIINNKDKVIKSYRDNILSPIKPPLSSKEIKSGENPNIGVIDFETFRYKDNTYKVYLGGFKTYLEDKACMYYIENKDDSDSVIITMIDELLRSKYSKTTFYCHNLGGFDVIFLLKLL